MASAFPTDTATRKIQTGAHIIPIGPANEMKDIPCSQGSNCWALYEQRVLLGSQQSWDLP